MKRCRSCEESHEDAEEHRAARRAELIHALRDHAPFVVLDPDGALEQLDGFDRDAAGGALYGDEVVDAVEGGGKGVGHGRWVAWCQTALTVRDFGDVAELLESLD